MSLTRTTSPTYYALPDEMILYIASFLDHNDDLDNLNEVFPQIITKEYIYSKYWNIFPNDGKYLYIDKFNDADRFGVFHGTFNVQTVYVDMNYVISHPELYAPYKYKAHIYLRAECRGCGNNGDGYATILLLAERSSALGRAQLLDNMLAIESEGGADSCNGDFYERHETPDYKFILTPIDREKIIEIMSPWFIQGYRIGINEIVDELLTIVY